MKPFLWVVREQTLAGLRLTTIQPSRQLPPGLFPRNVSAVEIMDQVSSGGQTVGAWHAQRTRALRCLVGSARVCLRWRHEGANYHTNVYLRAGPGEIIHVVIPRDVWYQVHFLGPDVVVQSLASGSRQADMLTYPDGYVPETSQSMESTELEKIVTE